MSGKQGTAVTDLMRYNVKPTAVRSEISLNNIKASNGNSFAGSSEGQIIFDVPAMSGGYYLDSAGSRFRFTLSMENTTNTVTTRIYLDTGPQSLIKRLEIHDTSGHLLENIDNYDCLVALQENCTGCQNVSGYRSAFNKECRILVDSTELVTNTNIKVKVPQYGGVVFGKDTDKGDYIPTTKTEEIPLEFTLVSGVFGGSAPKHYPLSAMNGFRITLTLQKPAFAFSSDNTTDAMDYTIRDPTLFMNVIRVDPEVDRGLITNAKGAVGKIRIHTHSWRTFTEALTVNQTVFNYPLPISVSSLKAVFFTFRPTTTGNDANIVTHTGMYKRWLTDYQFWVDGNPIPATPVQVKGPYGECVNELVRAWHVRLNDGDFATQLEPLRVKDEYATTATS